MARILLAEDDPLQGRSIKNAVERDGHEVIWERDGFLTLNKFKEEAIDLCILDAMMPVMNGFLLAKEIRRINPTIPLLFITSRNWSANGITGFESSGNDYIKKPVSDEELQVRIDNLLNRKHTAQGKKEDSGIYAIGSYTFYQGSQVLKRGNAIYSLTNKESELLKELVLRKNKIMERKLVLEKIWGEDNLFNSRNMDVYITKLRKYLMPDNSISIVNVRGVGFKLTEAEAS